MSDKAIDIIVTVVGFFLIFSFIFTSNYLIRKNCTPQFLRQVGVNPEELEFVNDKTPMAVGYFLNTGVALWKLYKYFHERELEKQENEWEIKHRIKI